MSIYFLEIMEMDLARFRSGVDFLFLFHQGKRKEEFGIGNNTSIKCEMTV